jgi:hypothetical protein
MSFCLLFFIFIFMVRPLEKVRVPSRAYFAFYKKTKRGYYHKLSF